MRQFRFFCLLSIFAWFPLVFSYSQTQDQQNLITAIAISGLKRTKRSVAEMPLQKFLGQAGDQLNVDEVYAAIKDTGILEPLSVSIAERLEGAGKILKIEVREKWSIFPIPVLFLNSGDLHFGGFFVDTNAFGLKDQFFVGGMYGPTGWMVGGGYIHAYSGAWFPGWQALTFFSRDERHDKDQQDQDLRIFKLDSIESRAGITYPFWDIFSWSLTGHFEEKILLDFDNPLRAPETGARMLGIGTQLSVRKTYWDGFLLSEQSAFVRYTFMGGIQSPSFHAIALGGVYKKSLIPGFRLNAHIGMVYEPEVPLYFESSPASVGINILPGSFFAQHLAGASLGFEKYLFKFPFGTLSSLVSYQALYSYGSILGHSFDHGVVGTLSFYLSQLAIPAVNVGVAFNIAAKYVQACFSVGLSF